MTDNQELMAVLGRNSPWGQSPELDLLRAVGLQPCPHQERQVQDYLEQGKL